MVVRAESTGWLRPAFVVVGAVTGLRLGLLAFNRTDLFVDEAQYWLWAQHLAFGYFSKPPLIAWLIRAVTWLVQSDDIFWIRMPGAVLHGGTALILGLLAARIMGRQAAIWTAALYVTLPMAEVGSLLLSTDTVMAPFFAAALVFYHRLLERHRMRDAVLVGLMTGLACLAKYAGVYLPAGILLAALIRRDLRPRLAEVAVMIAVWAAVIAPNLIWNFSNGFLTFAQTKQNIGWIDADDPLSTFDWGELLEFWTAQLAVIGPVMLAAIIAGLRHFQRQPFLAAFTLPPLLIVSVQAILGGANANWAVGAYFAGTVLAVTVLAGYPRLRQFSLVSNAAICLGLAVLTLFPDVGPTDAPLLHRYIGRAKISREIVNLAKAEGVVPVVVGNRNVIADLFYTARGAGLLFYAAPVAGRAMHQYQQIYPLPPDLDGPVLLVAQDPPGCKADARQLDVAATAYEGTGLAAYLVDAACARSLHAAP